MSAFVIANNTWSIILDGIKSSRQLDTAYKLHSILVADNALYHSLGSSDCLCANGLIDQFYF